jgi:hypothetical protein
MWKSDIEAKRLWVKILFEYRAPDIPYYLEAGKYQELKFKLRSSELHMEFYMDLLYDLCRLGDWFLGIYTGLKCLVTAKVSSVYVVFEVKFCFTIMLFHVILGLRINTHPLFESILN